MGNMSTDKPSKGEEMSRARRGITVALGLFALVAASLVIAACGGSDDSSSTAAGGTSTEVEATEGGETEASADREDISIVYASVIKGHPYFNSMECGAKEEGERLGVDVSAVGNSQYSVSNYTQVLNAAAAEQPDGVLMTIADPSAFFSTISSLDSQGMDVVGLDGEPKDPSNLLLNVISNNHQGGELAGEAMLEVVKPGEEVLVVEQEPANTVQAARGQGLIDVLEAAGVKVLPVQYSHEEVTKTTSIVEATLAEHPDLAGIYVTNGTDGPPSSQVVAQEGKTDQVSIVEYDASPEQVERIEKGTAYATVAQRPDLEAALGVRFLVEAMEGKEVPAKETVPTSIVTKDNLNDPKIQEALYSVDC